MLSLVPASAGKRCGESSNTLNVCYCGNDGFPSTWFQTTLWSFSASSEYQCGKEGDVCWFVRTLALCVAAAGSSRTDARR